MINEHIKEGILIKIEEFDKIIIHRHINPDLDALGSQLGLKYLLESIYLDKTIYVVGEKSEGLNFLGDMDIIEDIEYEGALVIVCDTANEDRVSDNRFNKGSYLIKIDHHPNLEPYGDLAWVDTTYSSTSEMIVNLFEDYFINSHSSKLFYAGIVGDTGRFLYSNTTYYTLMVASELLRAGIKPKEIFDELYKTKKETARLKGYILMNFNVTSNGVAYAYLSSELLDEFNVSKAEAANLVNEMSDIEGNNIWVLFIDYGDEIRARIRSKEKEINKVANDFNGGGHPLASGASVKTKDDMKKLIDSLDILLSE